MDAIITLSQLYPAVFYSLVFFVSLMVGSFLNVVIYRLPIMMERSWQQEYQSYFSEGAPTPNDKNSSASEEVFNLVNQTAHALAAAKFAHGKMFLLLATCSLKVNALNAKLEYQFVTRWLNCLLLSLYVCGLSIWCHIASTMGRIVYLHTRCSAVY